tara:strand:- start:153 stop:953 length:801 start_codon:yes stop_codon:yes gene_type:complete
MQLDFGLKKCYRLSLEDYGYPGDVCYWLRMDHFKDGSPEWQVLFEYYMRQQHWDKWITPGMTCIDIGGHSGDTAVPMAVLSRGTVLSSEPNPTIYPYLEMNCRMNDHLATMIPVMDAVSSSNEAMVTFGDHQNMMCNGGIVKQADLGTQQNIDKKTGDTIQVSTMTLETMLNQHLTKEQQDAIGFIKTDTEGHDIEIIASSRDILLKYKPVLFTEWFSSYSPWASKKLFETIEDCGYVAFNPETMAEVDPSTRTCEDLLCLHKDNL